MSESRLSLNPGGSSSATQLSGISILAHEVRSFIWILLCEDNEKDRRPCGIKVGRGGELSREWNEDRERLGRDGRDGSLWQTTSRVMCVPDGLEGENGSAASKRKLSSSRSWATISKVDSRYRFPNIPIKPTICGDRMDINLTAMLKIRSLWGVGRHVSGEKAFKTCCRMNVCSE